MKQFFFIIIFMALVLSACSGGAAPATVVTGSDSYVSPNLDTAYEGALAARNQLALGTMDLDGTPNAVTAEQAETLLPLWQALLGTQKSGTAAQAEVSALLEQIESSMTNDQLSAIKAMQLTQTDLQTWATANGITLGSGTGQPGQGKGMSPEARATRQAEEGRTPGSSGSGASSALLASVISYLELQAP